MCHLKNLHRLKAQRSDVTKMERPNLLSGYLERIRKLERTRKFARRKAAKEKQYGRLPKATQVASLAAKVANIRQDYLHKLSTQLVNPTCQKVANPGDGKRILQTDESKKKAQRCSILARGKVLELRKV